MDGAPLNTAYSHARKAVVETHKGNAQVARKEHELAAAEFATARKGTHDLEVMGLAWGELEVVLTVARLSAS
jgi:hypothetical protein